MKNTTRRIRCVFLHVEYVHTHSDTHFQLLSAPSSGSTAPELPDRDVFSTPATPCKQSRFMKVLSSPSKCLFGRFNQDYFSNIKSLLKEAMKKRGVGILFLPKFYCKLNPIKQCWGYTKWLYRLNPESLKEVDLEANTQKALGEILLVSICR